MNNQNLKLIDKAVLALSWHKRTDTALGIYKIRGESERKHHPKIISEETEHDQQHHLPIILYNNVEDADIGDHSIVHEICVKTEPGSGQDEDNNQEDESPPSSNTFIGCQVEFGYESVVVEVDAGQVDLEQPSTTTTEPPENLDDKNLLELSEYWTNNQQNQPNSGSSSPIRKSTNSNAKKGTKRSFTSNRKITSPPTKKKKHGSKGVPSSSFPSSSRKSKPNQTHETGKDAIHQCCYCGELVIGGAFIFHSHIRQKHRQFVDCITCVGCNSKLSSLFALRRHQGKCELMVDILKEWGEVGG
ncbi:hypothetical protein Fcan01_01641 [Folsomia candida]|uniref:Uncharacterized protein n=1 Tax=Folsomia candida TaxID=158441 RepID=A0A226EXI1_FOLCA|nr:hypothetical protein Fcan01_01641 [Folsomia candida]